MAEFAARLERFRGQMTDTEFATLLADMARVAERFAEIDGRPGANLPGLPTDFIELPPVDPSFPPHVPPVS